MEIRKSVNNVQGAMNLASALAKNVRGGECIEFVSDLGGGKTTFIQYFVSALGSDDVVTSPTFTIGKQYKTAESSVYHYDFYRLSEPGIIAEELAEVLQDDTGVILVEWGQTMKDVLPKSRILITINKVADNPDGRAFTITFPEKYHYMSKEVS